MNRRQFLLTAGAASALTLWRPPLLRPLDAEARAVRPWPRTERLIRVFSDQISEYLSGAQLRFVARNFAGLQKQTREFADRLRRVNPDFLILHYRLALGAGPALFIEGNDWVTDWDFVKRQDTWFFLSPAGERYHQTDWDWWLMDPDGPWRGYWVRRVTGECRLNDDDGVFADSFSVPHYLGSASFDPPFPPVDGPAERAWSRRIHSFLRYTRRQFKGRLKIIPNAGSLVTTRDTTDYAAADGVMIEGAAQWGPGNYFGEVDWALQQNRILRLARRGRIVIHQSYLDDPSDVTSRMFVLASYLLVKGPYSYIHLRVDLEPEWYPEFGLRLGPALDALPGRVSSLKWGGVYRRRFANGWAVANPSDESVTIPLPRPMRLVTPVGGGPIPEDGDVRAMRLTTCRVGKVTLGPNEGAVLLNEWESAVQ